MVTNYIHNATYKEIYDIHTDTESTSILTLHTPLNNYPRKMLEGFFKQYRKFKYAGATVKLRPVATLPADPEQISYEAGEMGIDPRDMVNPVLYRGYSGESLGTFLNLFNVPGVQAKRQQANVGGSYDSFFSDGWYGNSVDKASFMDQDSALDWRTTYLERLYYQSLSDPSFKKVRPQGGMRKFFYPLVYELATTVQRLAHNDDGTDFGESPNSVNNTGQLVYGRAEGITDTTTIEARNASVDLYRDEKYDANQPRSFINTTDRDAYKFAEDTDLPLQWRTEGIGGNTIGTRWTPIRRTTPVLTSHKRRLGFLDTDSVVVNTDKLWSSTYPVGGSYSNFGLPPDVVINPSDGLKKAVVNTTLPLINMGIFILPKAFKQEFFWRLEITHHFDFKKYRPMNGLVSPFDYDNMAGPVLEWSDWDDYGEQVFPVSSVTSTAKNVELVDVQGGVPEDLDPAYD